MFTNVKNCQPLPLSHPSGTGTVLVTVGDVNDVPPRFSQPEWRLEVTEGLPVHQVLATLTVLDHDAVNNFTFRVCSTLLLPSAAASFRKRLTVAFVSCLRISLVSDTVFTVFLNITFIS